MFKPGTVSNDIMSHEDMVPLSWRLGGEPDMKEKLLKGYGAAGKAFKVHLDGYNMMPFWKGETDQSPRDEFFYWTDDGTSPIAATTAGS